MNPGLGCQEAVSLLTEVLEQAVLGFGHHTEAWFECAPISVDVRTSLATANER